MASHENDDLAYGSDTDALGSPDPEYIVKTPIEERAASVRTDERNEAGYGSDADAPGSPDPGYMCETSVEQCTLAVMTNEPEETEPDSDFDFDVQEVLDVQIEATDARVEAIHDHAVAPTSHKNARRNSGSRAMVVITSEQQTAVFNGHDDYVAVESEDFDVQGIWDVDFGASIHEHTDTTQSGGIYTVGFDSDTDALGSPDPVVSVEISAGQPIERAVEAVRASVSSSDGESDGREEESLSGSDHLSIGSLDSDAVFDGPTTNENIEITAREARAMAFADNEDAAAAGLVQARIARLEREEGALARDRRYAESIAKEDAMPQEQQLGRITFEREVREDSKRHFIAQSQPQLSEQHLVHRVVQPVQQDEPVVEQQEQQEHLEQDGPEGPAVHEKAAPELIQRESATYAGWIGERCSKQEATPHSLQRKQGDKRQRLHEQEVLPEDEQTIAPECARSPKDRNSTERFESNTLLDWDEDSEASFQLDYTSTEPLSSPPRSETKNAPTDRADSLAPIASASQWRDGGRNRLHLNLNMNRINTDYILSSEFVDDINEMLDTIKNGSQHQATQIMRSCKDDPLNEGRKITFVGRRAMGTLWSVRIKYPTPSKYRPVQYRDYPLSAGGRPMCVRRVMRGTFDVPPMCQGGCSFGCPRPRTKEDNEQSLARVRMLRAEEKRVEAEKTDMLAKQKDREAMPPPRRRAYTSSPKLQSTPPSPRPHPRPLSAGNIFALVKAPLYPPKSPRLGPAKLLLTPDQWEKVESIKLSAMHSPSLLSDTLDTAEHANLAVSSRIAPKSEPRLQVRYTKVRDVARYKGNYYVKALPLSATQVTPLVPTIRAPPASMLPPSLTKSFVEQHRTNLQPSVTKINSSVAKKRPKKQHTKVESWQLDPARH
jgi:hypothetical protein